MNNKIARAFCLALHRTLSHDQMREVVRRNATPDYARCCASHDFCDANMVMAEAFERVMKRAPNPASDADAALWNDAWDIAKANNFEVSK